MKNTKNFKQYSWDISNIQLLFMIVLKIIVLLINM